jgi:hypothetical protein
MSTGSILRVAGTAVFLAGMLVACDKPPESPAAPQTPNVPTPPSPTTVTLVRLEIAGPASVEPGGTGQFTATAHYSDGSTLDKTSEASWRTSDDSVLAISSGGTAVARARGESSITATFNGRSSTKPEVLVLPAGTYRLRGAVRDAGLPVDGARVTVTENPAEGLTATSRNGEYRLYGIAGVADIVVTADAYVPIEHRVDVTGHQTVNFVLIPERPRDKAAGTYTLRVTAAGSCQTTLASNLLVRTYTAVIAQNDRRLNVELRDADFLRPYSTSPLANRFTGTADPDALRFRTWDAGGYYYGYYPDVVEVVSPTAWFSFVGSITTTPSLRGFAGTLDGDLVMYGVHFWPQVRCHSNSHRVEFFDPR